MTQTLRSPDTLLREVLFAVELVDPVSLSLVSTGVHVRAEGLQREPIVNLSGRFVWLTERGWPTRVLVTPQGLPYLPQLVAAPARGSAGPLRIALRPTAAYPFDSGVTAVRGQLRESSAPTAAAVAGARMQLAWFNLQGSSWLPAAPTTSTSDSPLEPESDAHGDFAAFLRLAALRPARPDLQDGLLRVRLQVTRRGLGGLETRSTAPTFVFAPNIAAGRVPEGQLLGRDLTLAWSDLLPI